MNESTHLNLVILYDGHENEYSVCDHNLTPEVAAEEIEKYRTSDLRALTVQQLRRHRASDAQQCRACRKDVARATGLEPTPRLQRRKS